MTKAPPRDTFWIFVLIAGLAVAGFAAFGYTGYWIGVHSLATPQTISSEPAVVWQDGHKFDRLPSGQYVHAPDCPNPADNYREGYKP